MIILKTYCILFDFKELRGRLVKAETISKVSLYGATNAAFISDVSPQNEQVYTEEPKSLLPPDEMVQEKPEDERESWDSKLTFLLATIG